jgi:hypothetical protein
VRCDLCVHAQAAPARQRLLCCCGDCAWLFLDTSRRLICDFPSLRVEARVQSFLCTCHPRPSAPSPPRRGSCGSCRAWITWGCVLRDAPGPGGRPAAAPAAVAAGRQLPRELVDGNGPAGMRLVGLQASGSAAVPSKPRQGPSS